MASEGRAPCVLPSDYHNRWVDLAEWSCKHQHGPACRYALMYALTLRRSVLADRMHIRHLSHECGRSRIDSRLRHVSRSLKILSWIACSTMWTRRLISRRRCSRTVHAARTALMSGRTGWHPGRSIAVIQTSRHSPPRSTSLQARSGRRWRYIWSRCGR